ncbi:MAG: isoprenylcysteine carboxylmethyltransferase family protein [Bacteroidia bacterium]
MVSLFFRNLFFTILQPGVVAGLMPYLILGRKRIFETISEMGLIEYTGMILLLVGLFIMLHCIVFFAWQGKGTLSPADPTKKLVVAGLYKYSRNPMYVGVMLILIGETILFHSFGMLLNSILIFTAFSLFILKVEEPRLKRDFPDEYVAYLRQVKRWF